MPLLVVEVEIRGGFPAPTVGNGHLKCCPASYHPALLKCSASVLGTQETVVVTPSSLYLLDPESWGFCYFNGNSLSSVLGTS